MAHEYKGHCNDEMMHRIYSEHKKELLEHEQDALKRLRTEIHDIVKGITNLKVTIYLDGIDPVSIINGKGENVLVMQFKKNGEIDYRWTEKTLGQKTKEFFGALARKLADKTIDIIADVIGEGIKKAIGFAARKAIQWK